MSTAAEEIDQWLRRRSKTQTTTPARHARTLAQRRNMAREADRNPIERWDLPAWIRWSTYENTDDATPSVA